MADMLLSIGVHDTMPSNYVSPENERPHLDHVIADANIPVVDFGVSDKSQIISQIEKACRLYGFFQVVNHGIAAELVKKVLAITLEFFCLPPEEKAKLYSDYPAKKIRLSTSFNVRKEKVHNWRGYPRLHCYPLEEFVPDWPSNPSSFK
ncbi:flavanone 3-dioxygenase 2-like [Zingiber officinale]|uniref:Non-haem dioxygenase N-terminal domain-containing protein n=1 Tax=Zingiber officinale TaxID=94328 RepID=A0A8J5IUC9_ZINOF|nr:flavanone 3-dioxygenase 2-like [Zingiber officinale]KAG6538718.1 hypothetical protein ZIOFF_003846 [Zingiber officinale]